MIVGSVDGDECQCSRLMDERQGVGVEGLGGLVRLFNGGGSEQNVRIGREREKTVAGW